MNRDHTSSNIDGNVKNRPVIRYRILNQRPTDPPREIEVHAVQEELEHLGVQGYLLREKIFTGDSLQQLRDAMDELEAKELEISGPGDGFSTSRQYGGLFLRYLMDKHPTFMNLLKFDPFLSVARAMLGPQVQMGMSARISYPSLDNQETHWHQHLRYVPNPLPPWFLRPHCMDVLVYLDDVTDDNGPLCIVPGSHNLLEDQPPADYYEDLPGQIVLRPSAGTAVFMHANLWHRAMPTTPGGSKRRLLLISYYPTWLKRSMYGTKPKNALTDSLLQDADEETLELLGKTGYM